LEKGVEKRRKTTVKVEKTTEESELVFMYIKRWVLRLDL
jgi:hypothetical protein